ncbi:MAG: YlxR family protein [Candidatus Dormibacteraceae bacterium]
MTTSARDKAVPERTCVGCRRQASQSELLRVVRSPQGLPRLDRGRRAPGRGAYLHRDPGCLEAARRRRALERALRCPIPEGLWSELEAALPGEAPPPS